MNGRVRFLADANFRQRIVRGLLRVQPAIDVLSAADAGLAGMPDPQVLALAAEQGRVLISHDVNTMPLHFSDFLTNGQHSAGVILLAQTLALRAAIETLHLIWEASLPEEWIDLLDFYP